MIYKKTKHRVGVQDSMDGDNQAIEIKKKKNKTKNGSIYERARKANGPVQTIVFRTAMEDVIFLKNKNFIFFIFLNRFDKLMIN